MVVKSRFYKGEQNWTPNILMGVKLSSFNSHVCTIIWYKSTGEKMGGYAKGLHWEGGHNRVIQQMIP